MFNLTNAFWLAASLFAYHVIMYVVFQFIGALTMAVMCDSVLDPNCGTIPPQTPTESPFSGSSDNFIVASVQGIWGVVSTILNTLTFNYDYINYSNSETVREFRNVIRSGLSFVSVIFVAGVAAVLFTRGRS